MSTRLKLFLSLLVLTLFGCADPREAPVVPSSEWSNLPEGCSELLDESEDDEVSIASPEGRDDDVVLETSSDACVDSRENVERKAETDRRFDFLLRIRRMFRIGDPSPHPDEPTRKGEEEPSPHPDGRKGEDPSPHPDHDEDASGNDWIVQS